MPLALNMQIDLVLYSVLAGIITGILFDVYRGIRGFNSIKILTIIQDILFWILASLIVFTFLLYTNYAFMTPYVYVFIIISILLYLKFISTYLYFWERIVFDIFIRVIRIILKNIIYNFKIIAYKITDKKK